MATSTKKKPLSKKWQTLLRLLPGYDPFRDDEGCWFEPKDAQLALDFFPECCCHVEGALAGEPFKLERWQQAFIANLFGWKMTDRQGRECRRYRESLLYVPRKNGKTPLVAALALYVFFCDGEDGSQCEIAASDREQAGKLFRHSKGMVEREPELMRQCRIYGGNASAGQSKSIVKEQDGSYLRAISAEGNSGHGSNLHLGIIDELHVQPNRDLYDAMRTSTASQNRSQPLLMWITTADFSRPSICNEVHDYACKVRDGSIINKHFLPVIYEATVEDDWTDPEVWKKANPNLGVSVSMDYLTRECAQAKEQPSYENTFKRLHLNMKTQQDVRAIPMDDWRKCGGVIDEEALRHRTCTAGLDLSTTTDITAFVMLFKPENEGEKWIVLPKFWIPGENAHKRANRDRVEYPTWIRQGFITPHEGNRLDYGMIRRDIHELRDKYNIQSVAVDPWNGTQLMLELQGDGIDIVEFRQGFASMNAPTKELLAMVGAHQFNHGDNPVLTWMAGNASTREDPAGNLKFDKGKSTERIDGLVALVMALGLTISQQESGWNYVPGTLSA